MNTKLREKANNNFEKDFFKLMNNANFGNVKLVTKEMGRNYLATEPNHCTKKCFTETLLAIDMRKTQILMNKPVYQGLLILDLSRTVMYEFCCDYVKPKYGENPKWILWILLYGCRELHCLCKNR